MEIIKDFIYVNKTAFKNSIFSLKYVPALAMILFVLGVGENYLLSLLTTYSRGGNFVLGFVRYIITIVFASALVGVLSDIVNYNRFRFKNIIEGTKRYYLPMSNTLFIVYIIEYLAHIILQNIDFQYTFIIDILVLIVLSTVYEKVYISEEYGIEAALNSVMFIKDNIIQWLPIVVIFVAAKFLLTINYVIFTFDITYIMNVVLYSLIMGILYIYKGHLFKILDGSSIRKRQFQGKF
ncbi:hypothetical protein [Helcococcus bovis]|uniref:hypothetical protein n=1 Tax=Helcococcus bovis TaxID=3153252 RepID=UPI0038BB2CEE